MGKGGNIMNKKYGLVGGFVLLAGIGAYMWVTESSEEANVQIVHSKDSFPCSQCGNRFAMTAKEAKQQLQSSQHAYICPSCNESSALEINILPPTDEGAGDAEKKERNRRPRPVLGRRPVQP